MSSGPALDTVDTTPVDPSATTRRHKVESLQEKQEASTSATERSVGPNGEQYPTDEDWATLRRVYGKVNWMIYIIGIVEMCERFAYYGTTAVCRYDHALETISADHTSRQFHTARAPYGRPLPISRCGWNLRAGWRSGYGPAGFDWTCPIQSVLLICHAYGW